MRYYAGQAFKGPHNTTITTREAYAGGPIIAVQTDWAEEVCTTFPTYVVTQLLDKGAAEAVHTCHDRSPYLEAWQAAERCAACQLIVAPVPF